MIPASFHDSIPSIPEAMHYRRMGQKNTRVKGDWGSRGWPLFQVLAASKEDIAQLSRAAWLNPAPKKSIKFFDVGETP